MSRKFQLYNMIMVLSFFFLWISFQIPENMEFGLGYFLILTIGVGHGANDLKIYFNKKKWNRKNTILFLTLYSLLVLVGTGLFFIFPEGLLFLFILISGYHFGQEHFEKYEIATNWLYHIFVGAYGLMIILTLLYLHARESLLIINDLLDSDLNQEVLMYPLIASVTLMVVSFFKFKDRFDLKEVLKELFYLLLLFTIFYTSNLIWGFAIYFILWHSIPSIYNQILYLEGIVTTHTVKTYIKDSLLYWVAALIFLGVLYYFLKDHTSLFLSIIIAFLGGITFPHVVVMHQLHNK